MMHEHFRQALEQCDIALVRKIWANVFPGMPQPETDDVVLQRIHYARTLMPIEFKLRAYSHAWLMERALPSGLPDNLRSRAQRMHPVTVAAVGIAVQSKYPVVRDSISGAMRNAILEAEGDGKLLDDAHVKKRMQEAREREKIALGLRGK